MKGFIKFALIAGAVAVAAKLVAAKMAEWEGLTESEVRSKIGARLPDGVPDEKRAAVTDAVVAKLRKRGALHDEAPAAPSGNGEVVDAAEGATEQS